MGALPAEDTMATEIKEYIIEEYVEDEDDAEDLDRSTPLGKFSTTLVMGMAEMFSDVLGTHVKKGVSERARRGLHLGGIPFGYDSCNGP